MVPRGRANKPKDQEEPGAGDPGLLQGNRGCHHLGAMAFCPGHCLRGLLRASLRGWWPPSQCPLRSRLLRVYPYASPRVSPLQRAWLSFIFVHTLAPVSPGSQRPSHRGQALAESSPAPPPPSWGFLRHWILYMQPLPDFSPWVQVAATQGTGTAAFWRVIGYNRCL